MSDLSYLVQLTSDAQDDLKRLDRLTAARIWKSLRRMASHVGAIPHKALKGELSGLYSLRIGDYRIIYDLDHTERLVIVITIGHRREIYRG
jgi:mRNA interferase RelE/StbE